MLLEYGTLRDNMTGTDIDLKKILFCGLNNDARTIVPSASLQDRDRERERAQPTTKHMLLVSLSFCNVLTIVL